MLSVPDPTLVTVKGRGWLVVPTTSVPNVNLAGDIATASDPPPRVPPPQAVRISASTSTKNKYGFIDVLDFIFPVTLSRTPLFVVAYATGITDIYTAAELLKNYGSRVLRKIFTAPVRSPETEFSEFRIRVFTAADVDWNMPSALAAAISSALAGTNRIARVSPFGSTPIPAISPRSLMKEAAIRVSSEPGSTSVVKSTMGSPCSDRNG
jgi:hypothetical protein